MCECKDCHETWWLPMELNFICFHTNFPLVYDDPPIDQICLSISSSPHFLGGPCPKLILIGHKHIYLVIGQTCFCYLCRLFPLYNVGGEIAAFYYLHFVGGYSRKLFRIGLEVAGIITQTQFCCPDTEQSNSSQLCTWILPQNCNYYLSY